LFCLKQKESTVCWRQRFRCRLAQVSISKLHFMNCFLIPRTNWKYWFHCCFRPKVGRFVLNSTPKLHTRSTSRHS
jgi:hypothetical protein